MMKRRTVFIVLAAVTVLSLAFFGVSRLVRWAGRPTGALAPSMVGNMLYVYQDYGAGTNHYNVKALIAGDGQQGLVHDMDEDAENAYSGSSAIHCTVDVQGDSWGGWLFTYGYHGADAGPYNLNWGEYEDCGFNLTGATELTFVARGDVGGERVEFFTAGLGWNPDTGRATEKYHDSSPKISLGAVTLSDEYTLYSIPLSRADLSYISCGFGFVVSGNYNSENVGFLLDDIAFHFPEDVVVPPPGTEETGLSASEIISLVTAAVTGVFAVVVAAMNLLSAGLGRKGAKAGGATVAAPGRKDDAASSTDSTPGGDGGG